jgi:carbon-monoxide dehydrogenase medium subunit
MTLNWEFDRPETIEDLTRQIAGPDVRLLAGGTDLIPRLHRSAQDRPVHLLDLSRLDGLRFIRETDGRVEIGALTTHAALADSALLQDCAPALAAAARSVGSPQTRSRGTLGGNLVNASPAADTVPPLLCLDAQVTLISAAGQRGMALAEFFQGPGRTGLHAGEFLYSVTFQRPTGRFGAAFQKIGRRSGMAIAVISAAAALDLTPDGRIRTARIALGSAAPTALRSPHAEALLTGQMPGAQVFQQAAQAVAADIAPISDVRATREYRLHAARVTVARLLAAAAEQAETRTA